MPDHQGAPDEMTGSQQDQQRETAPLRRDNSRVRPERASTAAAAEEATRPAFAPQASRGFPQSDPRPHPGPQQPYQPTSRQLAPEPPPARTGRSGVTPMGWVLRGLALVAVSVVSGLIWIAIKPGSGGESDAPPPGPQTRYQFQPLRKEEAFQGCRQVSRDEVATFFEKQECDHLTRALYSTTLPDGRRVLTSVVTVLMPDEASAQQLDALTTRDNTGNIKNLVEEGRDRNLPELNDKAYGSQRQGRLVVIGDSAYFDQKTPNKDPVLLDVTNDALKLGWPQDRAPQ
ncbi:hypothetical protein [Saccharopolyspora rosea]|uniref:Uncharacterized protein n=1 Tax=Saccharopolyspora rosea TaxID=524884 RepID=A0ABW3FUV8_9PSEU|nr:hypothetical protein [Saccharopolyspora rosea]